MKLRSIILPATALGAAAILLTPSESIGFTANGSSLNLSQRDVRIFNNFTDSQANNNTTADSNWPGYDGAELAIWKACVEWASEPHGGTGAGDSTQSAVGSGGANFDPSWQGNATGVGNANDNTHSELSGGSGGVLAFAELPSNDGWRIRYYSTWTWQDGPGNVFSGIDLQGVACHEYGHALGLGHTSASGATMRPSISGSGSGQRSINSDDIAGVQFVYGSASATKPSISSVTRTGNLLTINGSDFNANTDNEVWFTAGTPGGTGVPVKVTGVNSDGSSLTVAIPSDAGPGDLLVRRSNQSGNAALSNSWPYDIDPCGSETNYCVAGTTTNGCNGSMNGVGTPSASAGSGYSLQATNIEGDKQGLIFYGITGPRDIAWGASTSRLCVKAPTQRTPADNSNGTAGSCNGLISVDFNAYIQTPGKLGVPFSGGETVWAQCWFRDPPSVETTHLTDGIQFIVCP